MAVLRDERGVELGRRDIGNLRRTVRPGHQLYISGQLVEVQGEDGVHASRTDDVSGAELGHGVIRNCGLSTNAVLRRFKKLKVRHAPAITGLATSKKVPAMPARQASGARNATAISRSMTGLREATSTTRPGARRQRTTVPHRRKSPAKYRDLLEENYLARNDLSLEDMRIEFLYGEGASKLPGFRFKISG